MYYISVYYIIRMYIIYPYEYVLSLLYKNYNFKNTLHMSVCYALEKMSNLLDDSVSSPRDFNLNSAKFLRVENAEIGGILQWMKNSFVLD